MDISEAGEILGMGFSFTAEDTDRIIQQLALPKDSKILDIGTGVGNMAIALALRGYLVVTGEPADDDSVYAKQDWQKNAEKVGVDHLIQYQAFNASDMPFDDHTFDGIFALGALHHVKEDDRADVLQECVRASKQKAVICFFEPNSSLSQTIKEMDPAHPESADPVKYARGLNLESRKIEGTRFDAFIFNK